MNVSRLRSLNLSTKRSKIIAGSALAAVLLTGGGLAISGVASASESSTATTATATTDSTDGSIETGPDATIPEGADAPADGQAGPPPGEQDGGGAGGMAGGAGSLPPGVTAVTGDELESVSAAVLAEYPGATLLAAEVDSDGGYHAHISTVDEDLLLVDLDADLTVTGSSPDAQGGTPPTGGAAPEGAAATPST